VYSTSRYWILFWIILLAPWYAMGQQSMINIVDDKTDEPVPFAHVLFESSEDNEQKHLVTGFDGEVANDIEIRSFITISYIGYTTLYDTIDPGKSYTLHLKPSIQHIDEVVVTAQYAPERVDKSIYKVDVIGHRQIEQKAANNLTELLNTETNMRITQDGALGSGLSIQGLSGEHIKFLIDGVPVIGRLNGNIDISQLNLYNADHIEIIDGPMSVIYGSNALAGVVNIITKENKNDKFSAHVNTYLESVGVYNFDGGISSRFGNHSFSVSGGRNFFDGYSETDSLRSEQWKPKRQYFIDGYYLFKKNSLSLKASSSYFNEKLESKGNLLPPYFETAFDSYFYTTRFTNKIDVGKKWINKRYMNLIAAWSFYERRKETFFNNLTIPNESLTINPEDHDTTRFNHLMFRGTYSKSNQSSTMNYQVGFDINLETGEGKRITGQEQFIGDYAAFISIKWEPVKSFIVQPGLRGIYNTRYSAPLVYSINLKYDFSANLAVRGSFSRGFRSPSLKELYLNFVDVNHNILGNENLDAEDSYHLNFSLSYNQEAGKTFHGSDVSLFYNNINNIITLVQLGSNSYSYINIDKYITQGFQLDYSFRLYPQLRIKTGVGVTGTYNSISDEVEPKKKFHYSPDAVVNLTYKVVNWDLDISMYYKYTGELLYFYIDENEEVAEGFISDFHTLDISFQKSIFKRALMISAGMKNLFDNKSIPSVGGSGEVHTGGSDSYPAGWGRSVFMKLTYTFRKY